MVVDRAGQRHQDRRPPHHGQLGDGGGAGARDHQMRGGQASATSAKKRPARRRSSPPCRSRARGPNPRRGIAAPRAAGRAGRPATSLSADGTTSLSTRAPSEPPSTSSRSGRHGGAVGSIGTRHDRRSHRVAGDHDGCRLGQPFRRGKTQRQPVGIARQRAVGAAQHGVLFVQQHRGTPPQQPRGQHRRDRRIAAESHHDVGIQPGENARAPARCRPPAIPRPRRPAPRRVRRSRRRGSRIAPARRTPRCSGWPSAHRSSAPRAGCAPPVPRQRLGREEMAAGAAGRDDDRADPGPSHGASPWLRRRVSASSIPMPSATASTDDPP